MRRSRLKIFSGIFVCVFLFGIFAFIPRVFPEGSTVPDKLWKIQSIDTMKTSRDKARQELNNTDYDTNIKTELGLIKDTGANYVAIDTPYDNEFKPYLKRWVKYARDAGLHVWFRGNWSAWEGWFDYPKNLTPEEHIAKTSEFIKNNPDLFADKDIFDACPECENAHYWPQPAKNEEYLAFLRKQQASDQAAFATIHKNVHTNIASVIGGRAKEVMDQDTINAYENVVSIDHYVKNTRSMSDYLHYFPTKLNSKVVISEFGAPIPDINGDMSEDQQANFINAIFATFYQNKDTILGVNYFVLMDGTTKLLNDDYSLRKAYQIVKNYYSPGIIKGQVTNSHGDPLANVPIKSPEGLVNVRTDENGNYSFAMPPGSITLIAGGGKYTIKNKEAMIATSATEVTQNFQLDPINPDIFYKISDYLHKII